jgi:hypothetical protein
MDLNGSKASTPTQRCWRILDGIDARIDHPDVQRGLPCCIVCCLVSALVWTWSISWVPGLLGIKSSVGFGAAAVLVVPGTLPPWSVVVDCGSGKLAVHRYGRPSPNGWPRELPKVKVPLKLPELIAAHAGGNDDALAPIWALVDPAMRADGGSAALFFGATGGMRAALADGSVTAAQVATLGAAVRARYPDAAAVHFEVLSGAREAALELRAARFAFADAAQVFGAGAGAVGVLSAGGKTCQVSWAEGGAISADADLFAAERVAAAVGDDAALAWWGPHVAAGLAGAPHPLAGPFVGLTMMATAAEVAGVAGRPVAAAEVLAACGAVLAHPPDDAAWWAAFAAAESAAGRNPYGLSEADFARMTRLAVARLDAAVRTLFAPTTALFFARARDAPDGDGSLQIEWPLGALLSYPWG